MTSLRFYVKLQKWTGAVPSSQHTVHINPGYVLAIEPTNRHPPVAKLVVAGMDEPVHVVGSPEEVAELLTEGMQTPHAPPV